MNIQGNDDQSLLLPEDDTKDDKGQEPEVTPNSTEDVKADELKGRHIRMPKRTIVVEPVLVMMALAGLPMLLISQQYIYKKVFTDLSHNEQMNISDDANDTTDSDCILNKTDPVYLFREKVQTRSSQFQIILTVTQCIPGFFVTILLGAYSDKVGRKYAILPPMIFGLINALGYILVIALDLPIWCLIISTLIASFGGGFQTLLLGCFAYIADITTHEQRTFRIIIIEMCMLLSAALAPIGIGIWIKEMGFLYPFIFIFAIMLINLIYAIFFVPETVIKDPDAKFFTYAHMKVTVKLFTTEPDGGSKRRWKLIALIIAFFVSACVNVGSMSINTLFEMNQPLCWGSDMIGYYTAAWIASATIGGIVATQLLKLCLPDPGITLVSGLTSILEQLYKVCVRNTIMMFCGVVFSPLTILFIPSIRAVMSKLVDGTEQGAVFGAIACIEVVCNLVGGVTLNAVYQATMHISSGFVFFIAALIYAVGCSVIIFYLVRSRLEEKRHTTLLETTSGEENSIKA